MRGPAIGARRTVRYCCKDGNTISVNEFTIEFTSLYCVNCGGQAVWAHLTDTQWHVCIACRNTFDISNGPTYAPRGHWVMDDVIRAVRGRRGVARRGRVDDALIEQILEGGR